MSNWDGDSPITAGTVLTVVRVADNKLFKRVTVRYISDQFVVIENDRGREDFFLVGDVRFQVPLTPKEEAVADMVEITGRNNNASRQAFSDIYDAGYRKTDGA